MVFPLSTQDIHYMAVDKGEMALAEVAQRKAEQVDSESLGNVFLEIYELPLL